LNFDPVNRYTRERTLDLGILYGKHKVDVASLLRPIIKQLEEVGEKHIVVQRDGVQVAVSKIYCVSCSGDGPEAHVGIIRGFDNR
jgi:hypothetical protein